MRASDAEKLKAEYDALVKGLVGQGLLPGLPLSSNPATTSTSSTQNRGNLDTAESTGTSSVPTQY